jgi:hypothetical protein
MNGAQVFNTRTEFENRSRGKNNQKKEEEVTPHHEEKPQVVVGDNQNLDTSIHNHYVHRIYPNLTTSHQQFEDWDILAIEELVTEKERHSNSPQTTNFSPL